MSVCVKVLDCYRFSGMPHGKLQKAAFRLPKGRQQQRKRPSFGHQKTAFCNGGRFQAASQGRGRLVVPLKSKRILSGIGKHGESYCNLCRRASRFHNVDTFGQG